MEGISSGPDEIETKNREGSVPQRPVLVMLIDSTVLFHLCGDGGRDIHYLFTKRQAEKIVSVPCQTHLLPQALTANMRQQALLAKLHPDKCSEYKEFVQGSGAKECHGSTRQRSTRSPPVGAVVNERRSMRASFNWVNSSGQTGSQTW